MIGEYSIEERNERGKCFRSFNLGNDYIIVQEKLSINLSYERNKMVNRNKLKKSAYEY